MRRTIALRLAALSTAVLLTLVGGYLFMRLTGLGGLTALDTVRTALVMLSGFWLIWGSAAAIIGVFTPASRQLGDARKPPRGLTAILVPIYNEDPIATFARTAAMNRSLVDLGIAERFHFVILSDTQSLENAAQEAIWFNRLVDEPMSNGRIFYRRRERNIGRKAGNIEDFVERSGGAYDYALILDADSLMEGTTIGEMARRMDDDPRLGLFQTVPHIINARTLRHRRTKGERLSPEEGDRLYRVSKLVVLAEQLFGDKDKAAHWLNKAQKAFGGLTALEAAATTPGYVAAEETLERINHGFFA